MESRTVTRNGITYQQNTARQNVTEGECFREGKGADENGDLPRTDDSYLSPVELNGRSWASFPAGRCRGS